ncbi:MAG: hypothetical protein AAGD07_00410 [Planctomycetota bacterium]
MNQSSFCQASAAHATVDRRCQRRSRVERTPQLRPFSSGVQWAFAAAMLCGLSSGSSALRAETWTSLDGTKSIQAQMVGLWDQSVILRLSSGRRVTVSMNQLEAASRMQAEKVAAQLQESRERVAAELDRAAVAEAAPAPSPLPSPPDALPYTPVQPNVSATEAIAKIQQQIRNGHLIAVFDALPMNYRADLEAVIDLALAKLDPSAAETVFASIADLSDLMVTRQNWIRSHPRIKPTEEGGGWPEVLVAFDEVVLPLANLLRDTFPTEAMRPEVIQSASLSDWLRARDLAAAPHLQSLMEDHAVIQGEWLAKKEQDLMVMTRQMAPPGGSERRSNTAPREIAVELKKVDGYWLPAAIADGFAGWVQEQKDRLSALPDGGATLAEVLDVELPVLAMEPASPPPASDRFGGSDYEDEMYEDEMYEDEMYEDEMFEDEMYDDEMYADDEMGMYDGGMGGAPSFASAKPIDLSDESLPAWVPAVIQLAPLMQPMVVQLKAAPDAAAFYAGTEQAIGTIALVSKAVGGRASGGMGNRRGGRPFGF